MDKLSICSVSEEICRFRLHCHQELQTLGIIDGLSTLLRFLRKINLEMFFFSSITFAYYWERTGVKLQRKRFIRD